MMPMAAPGAIPVHHNQCQANTSKPDDDDDEDDDVDDCGETRGAFADLSEKQSQTPTDRNNTYSEAQRKRKDWAATHGQLHSHLHQ